MLVHGIMVLHGLKYILEQTRWYGRWDMLVWYVLTAWYGKHTVYSMVRLRYGMVCIDGMGKAQYMVWYVCGMVPWYGVVDV